VASEATVGVVEHPFATWGPLCTRMLPSASVQADWLSVCACVSSPRTVQSLVRSASHRRPLPTSSDSLRVLSPSRVVSARHGVDAGQSRPAAAMAKQISTRRGALAAAQARKLRSSISVIVAAGWLDARSASMHELTACRSVFCCCLCRLCRM
jgi:alkylation response protein AidB-like acyl-CoA dehydrogenase